MKLEAAIKLRAGGPGSGRHPEGGTQKLVGGHNSPSQFATNKKQLQSQLKSFSSKGKVTAVPGATGVHTARFSNFKDHAGLRGHLASLGYKVWGLSRFGGTNAVRFAKPEIANAPVRYVQPSKQQIARDTARGNEQALGTLSRYGY